MFSYPRVRAAAIVAVLLAHGARVQAQADGAKAAEAPGTAQKNDLALVVKPAEASFVAGAAPTFTLTFTNNQEKGQGFRIWNLQPECKQLVSVRLSGADGSAWEYQGRIESRKPSEYTFEKLTPGGSKTFEVALPDAAFEKQDALKKQTPACLPSGRYRASMVVKFPAYQRAPGEPISCWDSSLWSGTLETTASIEFTIGKLEASDAVKRP